MKVDQNRLHELVMLYISRQDISGITPEGLIDLYKRTYEEFKAANSDGRKMRMG